MRFVVCQTCKEREAPLLTVDALMSPATVQIIPLKECRFSRARFTTFLADTMLGPVQGRYVVAYEHRVVWMGTCPKCGCAAEEEGVSWVEQLSRWQRLLNRDRAEWKLRAEAWRTLDRWRDRLREGV